MNGERTDIKVVVPESFLQQAELLRPICGLAGLAIAIALVVVVLLVRNRKRYV